MKQELNEREKTVLRYLVHDFIETATPIGSRYISKRHEDVLGLSSASIRNVLSDLEYLGYLNHPHTSAGRVPTDLGYRFYLDKLMEIEVVSSSDRKKIKKNLDPSGIETDEILRETSKILGKISRQLCVVAGPQISSGSFEKMELVQVTSNRLMVILSVKSGLVRTILMEIYSEIPREKLDELARTLNERLNGLTISEIRETFRERVQDVSGEETGLIRLFIDSVDKLFSGTKVEKIHIGGAENVVLQPEFVNPKDLRGVIELINDEDIIIHVLEKNEALPEEVRVAIGKENKEGKLEPYSVITSTYSIGDVTGSIGVIGPKRMAYAKMIPLVNFVAKSISELFSPSQKA
ncbi:MAG: heat-inducible transcriptional repressor HrcA [Ignavibacteria bacterium]|nr:heat-inducible transcriptional repressor HrcA [Ignavibacteria bacterium]